MARALQYGLSDPWDLTLGELYCAMSGASERERIQARDRVASSWLTAALTRVERMPHLEVLLGDATEEELRTRAIEREREAAVELADLVRPPL